MHELWRSVFGNDHPVEVEIGPGTGTFILIAAEGSPRTNYFGIEHSHNRAKQLQAMIEQRGLRNARVIAADAACLVARAIPPESVAAYHIYFPDPWWKRRHHRRRLLTAPFALTLARTLLPGGHIYLATDVAAVLTRALDALAGCAALSRDLAVRSPRVGMTNFERKGLARGATIHEGVFVKQRSAADQPSMAAPITPAESPS
jgi:tRNA (guanine-N7-)-methyltransferase